MGCRLFPFQIPVSVLAISATQHPVKAGLSDAFMILNPSPDVPGESPPCGLLWLTLGEEGR